MSIARWMYLRRTVEKITTCLSLGMANLCGTCAVRVQSVRLAVEFLRKFD